MKIIPAKAVAPVRQGHMTDENDALAVAEAARRPNVKLAPLKTAEQQGMQAVQRSRELLVHERVSLSTHLRGLLMEFDIVIPHRPTLNLLYGRLCGLREDLKTGREPCASRHRGKEAKGALFTRADRWLT